MTLERNRKTRGIHVKKALKTITKQKACNKETITNQLFKYREQNL